MRPGFRRFPFWGVPTVCPKADTMLFQITPVSPATIGGIHQYHLRVVAVSCLVRFHLTDQILAFVKGIPAYLVHAGNTLVSQTDAETDAELGTKLHRLVQLAPYDGAHIGLADADNTVITAMTTIESNYSPLR